MSDFDPWNRRLYSRVEYARSRWNSRVWNLVAREMLRGWQHLRGLMWKIGERAEGDIPNVISTSPRPGDFNDRQLAQMHNRVQPRECAVSSSIRRHVFTTITAIDWLCDEQWVPRLIGLYCMLYTERPEETTRVIKYTISHAFLFPERIWFKGRRKFR